VLPLPNALLKQALTDDASGDETFTKDALGDEALPHDAYTSKKYSLRPSS
jgi:hypothetical protein